VEPQVCKRGSLALRSYSSSPQLHPSALNHESRKWMQYQKPMLTCVMHLILTMVRNSQSTQAQRPARAPSTCSGCLQSSKPTSARNVSLRDRQGEGCRGLQGPRASADAARVRESKAQACWGNRHCKGSRDRPGSVYRTDGSPTAAITHWNPCRSRAVCLMKIASPLCTIQAKSLPRRLSSEAFDARGAFVRCRRCASVPSNAVRSACLLAQDAMV
jgi:hypothetical protein